MKRSILAFGVVISSVFGATLWLSAQQGPNAPAGDFQIVPVQGNVYMLASPAGNITVQAGNDGVLVVDTGLEAWAPKILEAIRKISDKPIWWAINTDVSPEHVGGNAALLRLANAATGQRGRVIAHENVLNRMQSPPAGQPKAVEALWPNDEYGTPSKDISFNGEPVVIYHAPAAHSDGDSIVFFRRSDVLSVGSVFNVDRFPVIDLQNGGSVQGLIDALNRILQLTVPLKYQEAGTYVIPARGRVCDEAEVVEYRDMLTIVRDRIRDSIKKGMTLEQVKAAKPTRDYDAEYGETPGSRGVDAFVESIYKSLSQKR
jgi:cyclase